MTAFSFLGELSLLSNLIIGSTLDTDLVTTFLCDANYGLYRLQVYSNKMCLNCN